jgi:hypothetical protein
VLAGEPDSSDDVADLLGHQDRERTLVEHAVMDGARLVVTLVRRSDHTTAQLLIQRLERLTGNGLTYSAISHSLTPYLSSRDSGRPILLPPMGTSLSLGHLGVSLCPKAVTETATGWECIAGVRPELVSG